MMDYHPNPAMEMIKNKIEEIKQEALDLQVGDTKQVNCIFCNSTKPKLSISRITEGILYNCWRPNCTGRGFISSLPSSLYNTPKIKAFNAKPFNYETHNLTEEMLDFLWTKYYLSKGTLELNGIKQIKDRNGILIPLFNSNGFQYGNTTKFFDGNTKAMHYLEEAQTCMLHYPVSAYNTPWAILVEDVLSAIRITNSYHLCDGIALLGTDVNNDKVINIRSAGYTRITVALDHDATNKALGLKRKYGSFFKIFVVAPLQKDPKEMSSKELVKVLDFYG